MTPEQRRAARERCDKATPADSLFVRHSGEIWRHLGGTNENGSDEDFDYNARTDLPAALDALDAADSHQAQSDLRISNQRAEINRLTHELRESERRFQVFTTWRRECEMWRDKTSAFWEIYRLKKRIAELSEENSQMARMLAEPSENQELKARIAELTADAEFLTTPERLAEIIGEKNARIAELKADKARLDWLDRYRACRELSLLVNYHAWENKHYGDIREAIDAAMKPATFDPGEPKGAESIP